MAIPLVSDKGVTGEPMEDVMGEAIIEEAIVDGKIKDQSLLWFKRLDSILTSQN